MILAKSNKMAPKILAEALIKDLKKNKDYKKVEIAGPGFINFYLSPAMYQRRFGIFIKVS
jgi:arginyl-tRNA synthetase